jgi:transcription-repair coupling factor (superfamily II helicase)
MPTLVQAPVQIDVDGDRFLPDDYIVDNQQRFEMYKRLAELNAPEGVDDLLLELTDRFGSPPEEARRLLDMARARVWSRRAQVAQATARGNAWNIVFRHEAVINRTQIESWRQDLGDRAAFVSGPPFAVQIRPSLGQSADLAGLIRILTVLAGTTDAPSPSRASVPFE